MVRRVFFSFHFERDSWRAAQVRNSWVTKPDREVAGYLDAAGWEKVKKQGDQAIKRWINNQLNGTTVTAVLIGAETSNRKWVDYEIKQSRIRGNGLLGVYIHKLKDKDRKTGKKGVNPFDLWYTTKDGRKVYFSKIYSTYDWVDNDGYNNLGDWVEKAAKKAGK